MCVFYILQEVGVEIEVFVYDPLTGNHLKLSLNKLKFVVFEVGMNMSFELLNWTKNEDQDFLILNCTLELTKFIKSENEYPSK